MPAVTKSERSKLKICPNCGHENNEEDRFCANCGMRLTNAAPNAEEETPTPDQASSSREEAPTDATEQPAEPASTIPPSVTPSFSQPGNEWDRPQESVDDEWQMSDLGPPPGRKRPAWLWVIIAFFVAILLCCIIGFAFFNFTDTGQQIWDDAMATSEAMATEQAE